MGYIHKTLIKYLLGSDFEQMRNNVAILRNDINILDNRIDNVLRDKTFRELRDLVEEGTTDLGHMRDMFERFKNSYDTLCKWTTEIKDIHDKFNAFDKQSYISYMQADIRKLIAFMEEQKGKE